MRPASRRFGIRLATLAVGAMLFMATPTYAAEKEPGIRTLPEEKPWKQWVAAALFTAGCLAIAFKNPHRSHTN